ncbi:LPS translocon maturation chaperone LptM [Legionella nagasakiensis]|nr:lipoprotein [Legionella nagasakiensis]
MKIPSHIFFACIIILLVSACGQKGPLYLPDRYQQTTDKQ